MSIKDLLRILEEAENTAEYQLEAAIVDLTEQLSEIMEAKGVSRADLARKLGKSRAWVTKVLRGDRNLTLRTITEIFWELGYSARVASEPRWPRLSAWNESIGEYSSQGVITVQTRTVRRDDTDSRYVDQPITQPTENQNVVAA